MVPSDTIAWYKRPARLLSLCLKTEHSQLPNMSCFFKKLDNKETRLCQLTLFMFCSLICLHMTIWQCRPRFSNIRYDSEQSGLARCGSVWRLNTVFKWYAHCGSCFSSVKTDVHGITMNQFKIRDRQIYYIPWADANTNSACVGIVNPPSLCCICWYLKSWNGCSVVSNTTHGMQVVSCTCEMYSNEEHSCAILLQSIHHGKNSTTTFVKTKMSQVACKRTTHRTVAKCWRGSMLGGDETWCFSQMQHGLHEVGTSPYLPKWKIRFLP